jgi:hypothetical protein
VTPNDLIDEIHQHRAAILKEAGGTLDMLVKRLEQLDAEQRTHSGTPSPSPRQTNSR